MKHKGMILAVVLSLMLCGCGATGGEAINRADTYGEESVQMNAYSEDAVKGASGSAEVTDAESDSATTNQSEVENTTRKMIRTVGLDVETKEYDALLKNIESQINEYGGYIEDMSAYNGSMERTEKDERSASMTVRIPAESLDIFVSGVGESANITNKTESVQDVTLTYVDMDSHKKMLMEEQERLMELLSNATSIEDIITIEQRLSDVKYQIESMESQLRTFDNQVNYSTVNISIEEVGELTPVETQTTWERISSGFITNLKAVINGIKEFFINFMIALPFLVIWGIVIAAVILLLSFIVKKTEKRAIEVRKKQINSQKKNYDTVIYAKRPERAEEQEKE